MIAVVLAVGAVMAMVAAKGYDAVAYFANIAAPWMVFRPKWSRVKVTLVAGAVASLIAVFPGLCNRFLSVAMLYGLVLMPMGAVVVADHYLMRRLGMTSSTPSGPAGAGTWPPMVAWLMSLGICVLLYALVGIQEFFLCLPGWLLAGLIYLVASRWSQMHTGKGGTP